MSENKQVQVRPVDQLKQVLEAPSVQKQFENALGESRNLFIASLIDVYGGDSTLQKCNPSAVIQEALKAATLKLPINKSLGFAYIVPYKGAPQFQIGYKGLIQLAMRSGVYRYLNAEEVYRGEYRGEDKLTGTVDLSGTAESGEVVGYFAHLETLNGFRKTVYWSKARVEAHRNKYSKAWQREGSAWMTNFDGMARKTVLKALLSKYGLLSIEMADVVGREEVDPEEDYRQNANTELIDLEPVPENVDPETGEVKQPETTKEEPKEEMPSWV